MGGQPLEWWRAGAIVSARLGEGYAFLATALGTIGRRGMGVPPPDPVEGLLYALGRQRCLVDAPPAGRHARRRDARPRVSPWYGYSPLDPAHLASYDGVVFVKDAPPG